MILSLIVWLAMQGQVQAQKPWDNPIYDDPGIVQGQAYCCNPETDGPASVCGQYPQCLTTDESGNVTAQGWFPSEGMKPLTIYINGKPVPPREHVIEIKTRRENHRVCRANDLYDDYGCFIKTRELWIDNVKFGTIKGLD